MIRAEDLHLTDEDPASYQLLEVDRVLQLVLEQQAAELQVLPDIDALASANVPYIPPLVRPRKRQAPARDPLELSTHANRHQEGASQIVENDFHALEVSLASPNIKGRFGLAFFVPRAIAEGLQYAQVVINHFAVSDYYPSQSARLVRTNGRWHHVQERVAMPARGYSYEPTAQIADDDMAALQAFADRSDIPKAQQIGSELVMGLAPLINGTFEHV